MIIIGIGSNLAAPHFASPLRTALAALSRLPRIGIGVKLCSRWYLSAPVPASDQPWYVNAVAIVETRLAPLGLLAALLGVERQFSRRRSERNAARSLDLDLLDYDGWGFHRPRLLLPHPRLSERRFVLAPLAEIAPRWRHPALGRTAAELLVRLPAGQPIRPMEPMARAAGHCGCRGTPI